MDLVQRSDAWFAMRLGKVTASRIGDVMARTKSGPSASRANYLASLVLERITGRAESMFCTPAMQRGTDLEGQARAFYSLGINDPVTEIGFVAHPEIEHAGASPDGLVGSRGLVEIKVPNSATHLETLKGANIDRKYLYQMQWQISCTGRDWCDFVSFDDRFPAEMQLHVRRVNRDDDLIAELETEVAAFLAEVAATVEQLSTEYQRAA